MTEKQFKIFCAAFFAKEDELEKLINSKEDLIIPVQIPYNEKILDNYDVVFSVPDILKMNHDCWLDLKNEEQLINYEEVKPSSFFRSNLQCIMTIRMKYPDEWNGEYEYKNACGYFYISYNFYSDSEIDEYIERGFRRIDLELINHAIKRDEVKVLELLKNGANPMIDPDQENNGESQILSSLLMDAGYHFIEYGFYHRLYAQCGDSFQKTWNKPGTAYYMLRDLYLAASSERLYKAIDGFINKDKKDL